MTLINVSLTSLATGPCHTYSSGKNFATVDYIISNHDALRGLLSCLTIDEHPLNTSDHLPVACCLNLFHVRDPLKPTFSVDNLDWNQAVKENKVRAYAEASDDAVRLLLKKDYSSIDELNADILHVINELRSAATAHIPAKKK